MPSVFSHSKVPRISLIYPTYFSVILAINYAQTDKTGELAPLTIVGIDPKSEPE